MRKIIIFYCMLVFCCVSFAEICPTISQLKNTPLEGWVAYDSTSDSTLSAKRIAQFKKLAEQFVLAEWTKEKGKQDIIHCYYRDHEGSDLETYIARENFSPTNVKKYWYAVTGSMQCAASADKCAFQRTANGQARLIKQ